MTSAGYASRLIILVAMAAACGVPPMIEAAPAASAPRYVIQPGKAVGPIVLGTTVATSQNVVSVASEKIDVWIEYGRVAQIRTSNPSHQTESGFGPGQGNWEEAREALCQGASIKQETPSGFEIRCPLAGLVIEVADQVISAFVIMHAERLAKTSFSKSPRDARAGASRAPAHDAAQKAACEGACRVQFTGGEVKPSEGLILHFGVVYTGAPSYEPEAIQGSYTVLLTYGNARVAVAGKIVTVNAVRQFTTALAMCNRSRRQGCVEPGFTGYSVTLIDLAYVHCRLRTR